MKVSRIVHMRSPLIVKCFNRKKEIEPNVYPDKAGTHGGATVVLEGDTDTPALVQVKVGWCRFTDNYAKKKGIITAKAKDPEVVHLRDLAKTLESIEEQMLCQVSVHLRHHEDQREACLNDWNFVAKAFMPLREKMNG